MHNHLKSNIYALLMLFALPLFSLAKDSNQARILLEKGNVQYAKSQYKAAATSYQQVLDAGYQSVAVYFNLGNANYKLGDIPSAILNYEKAYKLAPGDGEIKLNLQLANLKITDKIEEVPEFFLTQWWKTFIFLFSIKGMSVFSMVCFILGFILLTTYLFVIAVFPKKAAFYAGITILSLGLISLLMLNVQSHYLNSHQQAIVFAGATDVKSGPDNKLKTLFVIHEGIKVNIIEHNSEWIKVELLNGNTGWIKLADVKQI